MSPCQGEAYLRRVASKYYAVQAFHPDPGIASSTRKQCRQKLVENLALDFPVQETAILMLGDFGRHAQDEDLGDVLELLLSQLGTRSLPLRSLSFTEVSGSA